MAYRSHFHAIDAIPYTKTLVTYCRVVHLVDHHNQKAHAQRLAEHGMFSRLASSFKSRLELAPSRRDDQNPDVGLRRAGNHMRHVIFMSRSIENGVALRLGLEGRPTYLYCFTFRTFLLIGVHDKG